VLGTNTTQVVGQTARWATITCVHVLQSSLRQVWTAEMLDKYGYDVAEALDCESDDAGEEQDALDIIQEFTESGVTWQFADGDLMLLADPEESAE
jgi:hypothetical protein